MRFGFWCQKPYFRTMNKTMLYSYHCSTPQLTHFHWHYREIPVVYAQPLIKPTEPLDLTGGIRLLNIIHGPSWQRTFEGYDNQRNKTPLCAQRKQIYPPCAPSTTIFSIWPMECKGWYVCTSRIDCQRWKSMITYFRISNRSDQSYISYKVEGS